MTTGPRSRVGHLSFFFREHKEEANIKGLFSEALERLAEETGGRSYFVAEAKELTPIYQTIQEELRSQYLLVYQSTNTSGSKAFRKIDVKVRQPGLEAKTIRGYYP